MPMPLAYGRKIATPSAAEASQTLQRAEAPPSEAPTTPTSSSGSATSINTAASSPKDYDARLQSVQRSLNSTSARLDRLTVAVEEIKQEHYRLVEFVDDIVKAYKESRAGAGNTARELGQGNENAGSSGIQESQGQKAVDIGESSDGSIRGEHGEMLPIRVAGKATGGATSGCAQTDADEKTGDMQ